MSLNQAALANQKLTFARLALNAARQNQEADDIQARVALHAWLDSSVTHMNQALAFFLREVAAQYKIKIQTPALDPELIFAEVVATSAAAEVVEIKSLMDKSSWLRDMLAAGRDPTVLATQFTSTEPPNDGLIPLRQVQESSPWESVANWLSSLQQLIERMRIGLIEE